MGSQFIKEAEQTLRKRRNVLVFAHSRSLFAKFSGKSKPLARVDLAGAQIQAAPAPAAARIDAVQCKRISGQNKPTGKGTPLRDDGDPDSSTARSGWAVGNFGCRRGRVWTSKFWRAMGLSGRRRRFDQITSGLINNKMDTNWCPHV
jgi:hypothetical protein